MISYLDGLFEELVNASYTELRNRYQIRDITRDEAVSLQEMLEEKLGFADPEGEIPEEGWQRSSWCVGGCGPIG